MKRKRRCAVVVVAIFGALFAASPVASAVSGPHFEGCGTIIQGVECPLFDSDRFGVYVLTNIDGFNVGDRVLVKGELELACVTPCMQGDGCILSNTIEVCPKAIPTLTEWGLIIFAVLLVGFMTWIIVRRRRRLIMSV